MSGLPDLPTLAQMTFAYGMLGKTFRGGASGYQQRGAAHLCGPDPETTYQGPRQGAAKTENVALYGACGIANGSGVIMGMPAQHQASVITRARIMEFLREFQRFGWVRPSGQSGFFNATWNTGGFLRVVSAHQAEMQDRRKTSQPGHTGQILILDEGQNLFDEDVRELLPSVAIAYLEGKSKVIIPGVGGPPASIIEAKKTMGYASFWIDDRIVMAEEPQFAPFFAQMERENTTEFYEANYKCLPITAGARLLYPDLPSLIPPPYYAGPSINVYGIDVGRTRDYTVIAHLRHWPAWGASHVLGFKQIPHGNLEDQARWCFEWIEAGGALPPEVTGQDRYWDDTQIGCETNGIGTGLSDPLQRRYFPRLQKVNVDEKRIHKAVQSLRVKFKQGAYSVSDEARSLRTGVPPQRLDALTFKIDEKGKYKYPHSDANAALIVAEVVAQRVETE